MRAVISGGLATKIIALGIHDYDESELQGMATDPDSMNVIEVADFSNLSTVDDRLRDLTCKGNTLHVTLYNCLPIRLF